MALPSGDLVKLVLAGVMYGAETWSIGLWWIPNLAGATPTPAQMNTVALACLNRFNTDFWSAASNPWKARCASGTTLSASKIYWYHNGTLSGAGSGAITGVAGTGSSIQPAYVSQVVTLLTDKPGRAHRGRIYLPATALPPNATTGLWGASAALVANLKTALSDMQGLDFGVFGGPSLEVVSQTLAATTPVTSLRMDNRPDTQRGRDKKILPTVFDGVVWP